MHAVARLVRDVKVFRCWYVVHDDGQTNLIERVVKNADKRLTAVTCR